MDRLLQKGSLGHTVRIYLVLLITWTISQNVQTLFWIIKLIYVQIIALRTFLSTVNVSDWKQRPFSCSHCDHSDIHQAPYSMKYLWI